FLAGAVAIGAIRPGVRQIPRVRPGHRHLGVRWLNNQGLQHRLGLDAVVDVGSADHGAQWHPVSVASYVDSRTTLTTIDGRRPRVLTPFFDGFLEPSRRT